VIGRDGTIQRAFESQFDALGHVAQACDALGGAR
jgi:hypothetical protein